MCANRKWVYSVFKFQNKVEWNKKAVKAFFKGIKKKSKLLHPSLAYVQIAP